MQPLKGKTALVTGAGQNIGAALGPEGMSRLFSEDATISADLKGFAFDANSGGSAGTGFEGGFGESPVKKRKPRSKPKLKLGAAKASGMLKVTFQPGKESIYRVDNVKRPDR